MSETLTDGPGGRRRSGATGRTRRHPAGRPHRAVGTGRPGTSPSGQDGDRRATGDHGGTGRRRRGGHDCARTRVSDAFRRWQLRTESLDGARDLRIMERMQARIVLPGDEEWPGGMDDLGVQTPVALWVRGPVRLARALEKSAAIVGSRAAEPYGLAVTNPGLGPSRGLTIVSGGAYGVDAAAHRTALSAGGTTIAFLACGVDVHYPRGNDALLTEIAQEGALVSECAPGQSAMRHRFLLRNRLIAAASSTTIVTAAGRRSGALHTANRAAELLRPVGAVPGSVLSDSCRRLPQARARGGGRARDRRARCWRSPVRSPTCRRRRVRSRRRCASRTR